MRVVVVCARCGRGGEYKLDTVGTVSVQYDMNKLIMIEIITINILHILHYLYSIHKYTALHVQY